MPGPVRSCVGCRRRRPAAELVRVVAGPDGSLAVGRHLPGRGAWLCPERGRCLELAVRSRSLERALRQTWFQPGAFEQLKASVEADARGGEGVGG